MRVLEVGPQGRCCGDGLKIDKIHTFLEYLGAIDFDQAEVGIFVFLAVAHDGGEMTLLRPEKVGVVVRRCM